MELTAEMAELLRKIVADAFDAGAVTDEDHDAALSFLNDGTLYGEQNQ